MRSNFFVFILCFACVLSERMIISFNSDESYAIALKYINHLKQISNSVQTLGNLGMMIVEIDASVLADFLGQNDEFRSCVGEISQDGQVSIELPQPQFSNIQSQVVDTLAPQQPCNSENTVKTSCSIISSNPNEANI